MPNIRLNRLYPFNARFEFTDIWAWLNFKFLICTKLNKIKCKTEIEKIYSRLFKQDYSSKIIQARLFKQDYSSKIIQARLFKQDYSSKIIQARLFKQDDSGK
ncbi:hypothetical protein BGV40_09315 [Methanosarcina sp. Ant1]|nr:hypothetical protein BGV40_09315 [Methanosarcina sp. Ant1]